MNEGLTSVQLFSTDAASRACAASCGGEQSQGTALVLESCIGGWSKCCLSWLQWHRCLCKMLYAIGEFYAEIKDFLYHYVIFIFNISPLLQSFTACCSLLHLALIPCHNNANVSNVLHFQFPRVFPFEHDLAATRRNIWTPLYVIRGQKKKGGL